MSPGCVWFWVAMFAEVGSVVGWIPRVAATVSGRGRCRPAAAALASCTRQSLGLAVMQLVPLSRARRHYFRPERTSCTVGPDNLDSHPFTTAEAAVTL